ncbi:hypothetical protein [Nocardia vinacea]|uniref:hypothetical protein n=1 Tax=Nocardia vinacea TaxID=96468 RepID=UPI0002FA6D7D|nr:hypothetical protein [Nocardia vinacea]
MTIPPSYPTSAAWITQRLGLTAQAIREDRILDEPHPTGVGIRRICDLFGLSDAGTTRYGSAVEHPDSARLSSQYSATALR